MQLKIRKTQPVILNVRQKKMSDCCDNLTFKRDFKRSYFAAGAGSVPWVAGASSCPAGGAWKS